MADIINGTDLVLFVDDTSTVVALAHATSHSISYSMSTRETSTKGSGKSKTIAPGRTSFSGSSDGLVTYSTDCDYHTLMGYIINRTPIYIASAQISEGNVDTAVKHYTGQVYLTSVDLSSTDQENVSYSISFEGNGDLEPVDAV